MTAPTKDQVLALARECEVFIPYSLTPQGVNPAAVALHTFALRIRADAIRECIDTVLGGRFLHDEAPPKQFASEVAKALTRLLEQP